ncbi:SDR family oxidoreductase [Gramella lutea]|uniref:SDR family oxidoreductase n=1 Tax=Christiangramia lutea TaxID=1607951 RepID=A0A9X2A888_9FLAO|nr:SDR family oxidoreductase [Christiangramia lutea]MCH4822055.1 SDR family oxidoreductase [Christiangramia lutea]
MNLEGKKAVITGGNSGIGFATAARLKERGAEVIITGRSEDRINSAANELGVKGVIADVSSVEAIDSLVSQVQETFEKIDILFVNAGIFAPGEVGNILEPEFDKQMGINFKGAVFTIEKFLPLMNEGGSIISLSSVNANAGMSNTSIYSASKAALNAYTRVAATELAGRKIRVNSVNPGPVSTPIFSKTGMPEEQLNSFAEAMQERVPLKRFGEPGDIANLIAFLVSDEASFITGAEYNIDGGININPLVG